MDDKLKNAAIKYVESCNETYKEMYGHHMKSFIAGAEWQKEQERQSYAKRDLEKAFEAGKKYGLGFYTDDDWVYDGEDEFQIITKSETSYFDDFDEWFNKTFPDQV